MTNKELAKKIKDRFRPFAFTCECKGTHPDCRMTLEDSYAIAQNETVIRIALWLEELPNDMPA